MGEVPVAIYESLLVKNAHDGMNIGWHRDMSRETTDAIFTLGIYLDPSRSGQGALRVMPGTHRMAADVCTLENDWKNGTVQAVDVEVDPGDVLIHDVMLVHSSGPITGFGQRRTIYFEFRSQSHVNSNPRFSPAWRTDRCELLKIAQEAWSQMSNGSDLIFDEAQTRFLDRLYQNHMSIEPGHYCLQFPQ